MEPWPSRVWTLAVAALAFAAAVALTSVLPGLSPGLLRLATATSVVELMLLALALGAGWASRRPTPDALGWRPGRLPGFVIAALLVATLGTSHALDAVLSLLDLREQTALSELTRALAGISGLELVLALVTIGLLPAFAEELLCRGLVQRGLAARFGAGVAIGSSSLLFALLHGDPIHALLAAPLGVHLGVVAWWADSTRPSVFCHAINNLAAVAAAALTLEVPGTPWMHLGAGALLAAASWRIAVALGPPAAAHSPLQPDPGTDDA